MAAQTGDAAQLELEWEKLREAQAQLAKEKEEFKQSLASSNIEWKLFIGNLDPATGEDELKAKFEKFGTLKEVIMLKDREGNSKRSGFVKFFFKNHADAAIEAVHERISDGNEAQPMVVKFARDRNAMPARGGFGGRGPAGMRGGMGNMGNTGMGMRQQSAYPSVYNQQQGYGGMGAAMGGMGMGGMGGGGMGGMTQGGMGGMAQGGQVGPSAFGQGGAPAYGSGAAYGGGAARGPSYAATPSSSSGAGRGPAGANLYLNNLSSFATDADIRTMFGEYGTVLSTKLFPQAGYGFVSFDTEQSAASAIQCLNGMQTSDGNRLEVSLKKEKGQRFTPY